MKLESAAKELSTRKPIPGSTRVFILLFTALALGYVGRPPAQQLGTQGQGPNQIALGPTTEEELAQQDPEAIAAQQAEAQAQAQAQAAGKKSTSKTAAAPKGTACASGKNGGRTDAGVSATKIRLATTAVQDGTAASLLKSSPTAMKAVIDKVNAAGGICGRRLSLQVVNDGFNASLGLQYLKNFIDEKNPEKDIFAFPVVPTAEGLSQAITNKEINKAGMPVVGSDGMRIEQYQEPWVWPVAAATVSTMRIIASYAYKVEGARTFGIVWDGKYKFGVEGAVAFKSQVEAMGGRWVETKLDPDQSSYASEVAEWNGASKCGSKACDAVALLLLPDTAKNWLDRLPATGRLYSAGAQTLFTESFGDGCVEALKDNCNGFAVWTGYNPPIGTYATLPGIAKYVSDVKTISPGTDVKNQFTEGAYFGMSLFVEALKKVGHNLTRAGLKSTLDSMDYNTDFTSNLSWRPGKHNANVRARSFSVAVSQEKWNWADEGTGWVLDPAFGG